MIAIQEKAGKKRIKTKSKKSERGQLRGGWWQKNGNNLRYSGPQDHRTFTDSEKFFVKKINVCDTHNLGQQHQKDRNSGNVRMSQAWQQERGRTSERGPGRV